MKQPQRMHYKTIATVSSKPLSREKNKNCVRDWDPFSSNTGKSQLAKDL